MKVRTLFEAFSGGAVETPRDGYRRNELALLENGRIAPDGSVVPRHGSLRTGTQAMTASSGTAYIVGMTLSGAPIVMVGEPGALNNSRTFDPEVNITKWNFIATSLDGTNFGFSASVGGWRRSFFVGGSEINYDGHTTIIPPAPGNGTDGAGAFHNDRLWWSNSGTAVLYGSKIGDPATWSTPDGVVLPIADARGEGIYALGVAGSELLVFKPNSVSVVTGFGSSDIIVASGSRGVGGPGEGTIYQGSVVSLKGGCAWLAPQRGILFYQPGNRIVNLTQRIQRMIDSFTPPLSTTTERSANVAIYHGHYDEYWILGTSTLSEYSGKSIIIRINMTTGACSWDVIDGTWPYSLSVYQDAPIIGGNDGLLRSYDVSPATGGFGSSVAGVAKYDIREDDLSSSNSGSPAYTYQGHTNGSGEPYTLKMRTYPEAFGQKMRKKWGRTLRIMAKGASSLSARLIADQNVIDYDGEVSATKTLTGKAGTGQFPSFAGRFSHRGHTLGAEISATFDENAVNPDTVAIYAAELEAEIIERATR